MHLKHGMVVRKAIIFFYSFLISFLYLSYTDDNVLRKCNDIVFDCLRVVDDVRSADYKTVEAFLPVVK